MAIDPLDEVRRGYDAVADEYARRISGELDQKPFDRALLDRYAVRLAGRGPVWDLGCGPGHVARYLHERGVSVAGMDLSSELLRWAERLNPGLPFHQGDFRRLPADHDAWAGIVAFYSIIHLPPGEVLPTLKEWHRVLRPGGVLFVAVHLGSELRHVEDWWGRRVNIDFRFFQTDELETALEAAGYAVEEVVEREPYPGVETQTRRAYVLATKPPAGGAA